MNKIFMSFLVMTIITIGFGELVMPAYCQKGNPPFITTSLINNITCTTAHCGGIFGKLIEKPTAYGVCWSTSPNPTINNQRTIETKPYNSVGAFGSNVTGLNPNTFYYIRAYGTNSYGTGYGSVRTFTTLMVQNLANAGVDIYPLYGATTATLAGNTPTSGTGKWTVYYGTATITNPNSPVSGVTGLAIQGKVTLRWTITDPICMTSHDDVDITTFTGPFICGTSIAPDIDGNPYHTVQIGTQCWMSESLRTKHYADGTAITDGKTAGNITGNYTTKYYFDYNNNPVNSLPFGKLYTWAAVMNGAASSNSVPSGVQGPCPAGWHVPSDAEWILLENFLGGSNIAANKLKQTGTAYWLTTDANVTNSSGFSALGSGLRSNDNTFIAAYNYGYWWTSTEKNAGTAWEHYITYYGSDVHRFSPTKDYGNSLRCLKN
ncbi:MAG: fibrobacter succinogenes major paralogous domain-containing protein [Bacteroidetes bacterium]|nr:fibrobacter succinogenes major paralogous domain-containing protein [Bacteroidota bacterium]